jgi:NADP-dependent aldehyde dehydrogenase
VFGPLSVVVRVESEAELHTLIYEIDGQLTASVLGTETTIGKYKGIFKALEQRVGRLIFNGVPTGVEVSAAMQHGGPFPASTDARFTAVGESAMRRWLRPISYQNYTNEMLPQALQDGNPLKLWRSLNGALSRD